MNCLVLVLYLYIYFLSLGCYFLYLELYITDTALKVSQSLYCFTISISHGVENYFPKLWGTGISDAIFSRVLFLPASLHNLHYLFRKPPGLYAVSPLLYLMVFSTISPGSGVWVSMMLFLMVTSPNSDESRYYLYVFCFREQPYWIYFPVKVYTKQGLNVEPKFHLRAVYTNYLHYLVTP